MKTKNRKFTMAIELSLQEKYFAWLWSLANKSIATTTYVQPLNPLSRKLVAKEIDVDKVIGSSIRHDALINAKQHFALLTDSPPYSKATESIAKISKYLLEIKKDLDTILPGIKEQPESKQLLYSQLKKQNHPVCTEIESLTKMLEQNKKIMSQLDRFLGLAQKHASKEETVFVREKVLNELTGEHLWDGKVVCENKNEYSRFTKESFIAFTNQLEKEKFKDVLKDSAKLMEITNIYLDKIDKKVSVSYFVGFKDVYNNLSKNEKHRSILKIISDFLSALVGIDTEKKSVDKFFGTKHMEAKKQPKNKEISL